MSKIKNYIIISVTAIFVFGFFVFSILLPDAEISKSERRRLGSFPEITVKNIMSGKFMTDFESYTLDQFPLRDEFRTLKGFTTLYPMGQKENNRFFEYENQIVKMEYPMNKESIDHATDSFRYIYESYLKDKDVKIYLSLIPDKNCFVGENEGYLSMDYNAFADRVKGSMDYAKYINIFPLLELSDYYSTDTHWRQEKIVDVAQHIASEMDMPLDSEYTENKATDSFYGVYHGQFALPLKADSLYYLTGDVTDNCVVTDMENGSVIPIYDMEKLESDDPQKIADPYEMFLSGPNRAILEIENKKAETKRELIIFRDSYANSIAPFFAEGYSKITLIDIRRVAPQYLGNFVEFNSQDILFLQSTLVLNDSSEIK